MARKFVINDGDLIIGDVDYHWQLLKGRDKSKTVGGGRWFYDKEANTIYFYGESHDYGCVSKEAFDSSFKQPSVENANIIFSHKDRFLAVLKEVQIKQTAL